MEKNLAWAMLAGPGAAHSFCQAASPESPEIIQGPAPSMNAIPDFNDSELWTVQTALRERYGREVEVELAETEVRLSLHTSNMTSCPTLYWEADGCHFLVVKTGAERFRCQFFYRVHQMYGTGIDEYDNLTECVVTLLQVQADFVAKQRESGG
jgi:hypothetical protein